MHRKTSHTIWYRSNQTECVLHTHTRAVTAHALVCAALTCIQYKQTKTLHLRADCRRACETRCGNENIEMNETTRKNRQQQRQEQRRRQRLQPGHIRFGSAAWCAIHMCGCAVHFILCCWCRRCRGCCCDWHPLSGQREKCAQDK